MYYRPRSDYRILDAQGVGVGRKIVPRYSFEFYYCMTLPEVSASFVPVV